jgi:ABC-type sugar transport system ATPase subunit
MRSDSSRCLSARGISKSFGATKALVDVNLDVARGEIHALLGENGAGKTTLVKIIVGVEKLDSGSITLEDRRIDPFHERLSDLGIEVVHQELSVLPNLSIAENILIRNLPLRTGHFALFTGFVDRRRLVEQAREKLELLGLHLDPRRPVADLSQAERQLVEITRAWAQSPKLILFDEPTSSLPPDQRGALFERIERIRDTGVGVVFITHFIEEALQLSDRITVLRDGRNVGTFAAAERSTVDVVELMSGRPAGTVFPSHVSDKHSETAKLAVEHIACAPKLRDVSFSVHRGEIVGLAGLVGSGRTETMKVVFGVTPHTSGTVRVDGQPRSFRSPADAIAAGIAFIPEDRQDESIFANDTVTNNICVAAVMSGRDPAMSFSDFVLNRGGMALAAERYRDTLGIKLRSIRSPITSLSGGNQQKAILGRWMATKPDIVLADEPTRGISIASKMEIYRILRQMAADGAAIVIASSEFEELVGLCDRVVILHNGVTLGDADISGMTAADLLHVVLAKSA